MSEPPHTPSTGPFAAVWQAIVRVWRYGKQIAALEARVSALEAGLDEPFRCRMCGARNSAFKEGGGSMAQGFQLEFWRCKACGKSEDRWVRPK